MMKKIDAFALLGLGLYFFYFLAWGSLQNFNQKIDPCENLFCDFSIHYYPTAQAIFETKEPIYGYLYSPFFAILTAPLGNLPLNTATQTWGIIQIILTLLLFIAPLSALRLDTLTKQLIYAGIFFTSLPVIHNFKWGQVSSLMTLAILGAWLAQKNGKSVWAGILLGFGASIKYYPGIFILYFLFKKDKQALLAFALTCFALLLLLPISLLGFDHWLNFMSLSFQKLSVLGATASNPNAQYAPYVLARLLGVDPARVFVLKIFRYAGFMIGLFNMILLWQINKHKLDSTGVFSISLLFCTLPFLIETAWHHYFIFLPFIQAALLQSKLKQRLKPFIIISIVASSVFVVNLFPAWESYTRWGFSLCSTLALLTVIYFHISLLRKSIVGQAKSLTPS